MGEMGLLHSLNIQPIFLHQSKQPEARLDEQSAEYKKKVLFV
jgi:hypothetical protein